MGKKSVIAGLFDSGVDITHADLAGQVKASASASCLGGIANPSQAIWANDVIGHGTFTSSMVAAAKNNVGIVGVAPNVTLAMVKVAVDDFNDPNFGQVFADAFVCAIDWAIAHNWDLINASLTIDPFTAPDDDTFCSDQPDRAAVVKIVRRAVLEAARNKVTLVARDRQRVHGPRQPGRDHRRHELQAAPDPVRRASSASARSVSRASWRSIRTTASARPT